MTIATRLTAAGSIVAPHLHTLTDVLEWWQGGTLLRSVGLVGMGWALSSG